LRGGRVPSGGSWGAIRELDKDLESHNVHLHDLFSFNVQNRYWNWKLESDGRFSVSSHRMAIDDSSSRFTETETKWNNIVPGKINLLLWRMRLGRLPTKPNLMKRGVMLNSDLCPLCLSAQESDEHLFVHCSTSKEVRARIHAWCPDFPFVIASVADLLGDYDVVNNASKKKVIVGALVVAYVWIIWNNRNLLVFNKRGNPLSIIVSEVISYS